MNRNEELRNSYERKKMQPNPFVEKLTALNDIGNEGNQEV